MLERLGNLENNLALLNEIKRQKSVEKIQQDKFDEWALRYGLFESIRLNFTTIWTIWRILKLSSKRFSPTYHDKNTDILD